MGIPIKKNKWLKYKFMKRSSRLARCLPATRVMRKANFWKLMKKYRRVIVKPVGGSRGRGVFQITSLGGNSYEIRIEKRRLQLTGKSSTYRYLHNYIGSRRFIVQRWIRRATINGRPFDIRVIIQRKPGSSSWIVTGKVAKLAGKGYIVSNITRSGGKVMKVRTAIKRSSIRSYSSTKLLRKLNKVGVLSAKRLDRLYTGHRIYGLDVALDYKGRAWIIEANLYPSRSHFRLLKDKTMLKRINAFRAYNSSYEDDEKPNGDEKE